MAEKKQLQTNDLDTTLDMYSICQPNKVIHRQDCKLCKSEYREEVETEFSVTESYKSAYLKIKYKDSNISYDAVYRHLRNHFIPYFRGMMIKDYAEHISQMKQGKYNKRKEIMERIRILQNKMYQIEALSAGGDLNELSKSADAVNKLMASISRLEDQLTDMDRDLDPVYLLLQNLKEVMNEKAQENNDPAIRQILKDVFTKLVAQVKENEILVEKK